jgi:hypothetical protein
MLKPIVAINQFSTHCVGNLSWTNIRLIMRLENKTEREYYVKQSSEQNWSSRLLEQHIKLQINGIKR